MAMDKLPLLINISGISTLLPILCSIAILRSEGPGKKAMLIFWSFAAICEVIGFTMAIHRIHNHWFLLFFNLLEFPLIAIIFKYWEPKTNFIRYYWWGILLYVFIYLLVVISLFQSGLQSFAINNFIRPTGSLLVCFLAMRLFYYILIDLNVIPHKDFRFYFAASILVYFASGAVIFAIPMVGPEISNFWIFHPFFNITHNMLFIMAIYFFRKYPTEPLGKGNSPLSII